VLIALRSWSAGRFQVAVVVARWRADGLRNTKLSRSAMIAFSSTAQPGCSAGGMAASRLPGRSEAWRSLPDVFYQGRDGPRAIGIRCVFRHPSPLSAMNGQSFPRRSAKGFADGHWWISILSKPASTLPEPKIYFPENGESDDEKGRRAGRPSLHLGCSHVLPRRAWLPRRSLNGGRHGRVRGTRQDGR
jgi:hypothetical protein